MSVHEIFQPILRTMAHYTCPDCGVLNNHLASCPTQLATPEQRIRRAAQLFNCFNDFGGTKACREIGISEEEIAVGRNLRRFQLNEWRTLNAIHGSPTFGARTIPQDELDELRAGEQRIIDAHLSSLRKPNTFQQLTLEEQLVASIAVVNYRKGAA